MSATLHLSGTVLTIFNNQLAVAAHGGKYPWVITEAIIIICGSMNKLSNLLSSHFTRGNIASEYDVTF